MATQLQKVKVDIESIIQKWARENQGARLTSTALNTLLSDVQDYNGSDVDYAITQLVCNGVLRIQLRHTNIHGIILPSYIKSEFTLVVAQQTACTPKKQTSDELP